MAKLEVKNGITQAPESAGAAASAAAPSIVGPLPEYYSCLDNGASLILRCKRCGKGYKLPAESVHPGNKIALMNHVRTHSELEEL